MHAKFRIRILLLSRLRERPSHNTTRCMGTLCMKETHPRALQQRPATATHHDPALMSTASSWMHASCLFEFLALMMIFRLFLEIKNFYRIVFQKVCRSFARVSLAACSSAGGASHCKPLSATVLLLPEPKSLLKVFLPTKMFPTFTPDIRNDDKVKMEEKESA